MHVYINMENSSDPCLTTSKLLHCEAKVNFALEGSSCRSRIAELILAIPSLLYIYIYSYIYYIYISYYLLYILYHIFIIYIILYTYYIYTHAEGLTCGSPVGHPWSLISCAMIPNAIRFPSRSLMSLSFTANAALNGPPVSAIPPQFPFLKWHF